MKLYIGILTLVTAAALALVGCSGSSKVDTSALQKSFAPAESTLKSSADKAITCVKNADYKGALDELQKLAANAKLTDDQKKAITDVMAQVQKVISETATKAAGEASKTMGDMQKKLPK